MSTHRLYVPRLLGHCFALVTIAALSWACGATTTQTGQQARGRGAPIAERGATKPSGESSAEPGATESPSQAQSSHRVQLSRPLKVDDRGRVHIKVVSEIRQSFTMGDKNRETNQKLQVEVKAIQTVRKVTAEGRVLSIDLLIDQAIANVGDTEVELAPKGSVLSVKRFGSPPRMTLDGGPVSMKIKRLLKQVFSIKDLSSTDQELFGTDTTLSVGETWLVNGEALSEMFSKIGLNVAAENISGESTLLGVNKCGQTVCQKTKTDFSASDFQPMKATPNVDVQDASFSGYAKRSLAAVPMSGPSTANEGFDMVMKLAMERNGVVMEMGRSVIYKRSYTWVPMRAAAP
ncbi:MAG TPA: hypothetical protein DCQ06_03165 [Myxococcales bacterium]|nr:hypothetical protein [Myxococcales bacterium]